MLSAQSPEGALLVDKPTGMTSHDVVAAVRRQFRVKKVGHCGTLDPNATGLLTLVLGKATKLSEKLMGQDKKYEGHIEFGLETDSYDSDGSIVHEKETPHLDVDLLNQAMKDFQGDLMQAPPMVSAVKKDGVPLYKLARKGVQIEREPRLVHVYFFNFLTYENPVAFFQMGCTKGTYVRSLAHDLGQKLGCGAILKTLRRTASGSMKIEQAAPLEDIKKWTLSELHQRIVPVPKILQMCE